MKHCIFLSYAVIIIFIDLGPTSTNSSEVFSAFEGAPVPTTQASDILALFSAPAVAAPLSVSLFSVQHIYDVPAGVWLNYKLKTTPNGGRGSTWLVQV